MLRFDAQCGRWWNLSKLGLPGKFVIYCEHALEGIMEFFPPLLFFFLVTNSFDLLHTPIMHSQPWCTPTLKAMVQPAMDLAPQKLWIKTKLYKLIYLRCCSYSNKWLTSANPRKQKGGEHCEKDSAWFCFFGNGGLGLWAKKGKWHTGAKKRNRFSLGASRRTCFRWHFNFRSVKLVFCLSFPRSLPALEMSRGF